MGRSGHASQAFSARRSPSHARCSKRCPEERMAHVELLVPDLGNFADVAVVDVLVGPGDRIEVETPLITLETDKATLDVPATTAGTVIAVSVRKGDKVSKGSV